MEFPKDLRYSIEHEWVRLEGDIATIGITDFAQSELGDIIYVETPNVEQTFQKGDIFGNVEAVKTVSDLFIPLSGEVTEVNKTVIRKSELVNSDPYGEGWIIKIKNFPPDEYTSLFTAEEYKISIGKE
ncbi:MAG: glycine cleavage system protein GcvH [Sediminibacterium sp.]